MKTTVLAVLMWTIFSGKLWACATCFGGPSSTWNRGFFWGIVVLLALPAVLLGTLVGLVVRHHRKGPSGDVAPSR